MKYKVGSRHEALPSGEYKVKLLEIKEGEFMKKRKLLTLSFEVVVGPFTGAHANAFINSNYVSFSSHTKLFKWCEKVSGEALEPGEELDTDVFKDKILIVHIEPKNSRKTGVPFSNVTDIKGVFLEL